LILDLDIGNTRCKWRLSTAGGEALASGAGTNPADAFADAAAAGGADLSRVRVSNVAGEQVGQEVRRMAAALGLAPEFARAVPAWGVVRNGYRDPARLGVDRWLAICAAWARTGGPCLVVDAGSAITIDVLDGSGRHGGGYIVPGLRLMAGSLLTDTSGVRFAPGWEGVDTVPGLTTEQAVKQGLLRMVTSFINQCRPGRAPDGTESTRKLVLTGGDAAVLMPFLEADIDLVQALVLDGLALVMP